MPGDNRESGSLKERELNPSAEDLEKEFGGDFSDDEKKRLNNLSSAVAANDGDWKTNLSKDKKPGLKKRMSTAKKVWLGGSGAAALISLLFATFAFMQPYRADIIMRHIQNRVGEIPQNAVENRLQWYVARYLMLRAAEKADTSFEKERSYVYIGDGVFKTLYTNWKGAKLETILEKDYKMRVRPAQPVGQLLGRELTKPRNWVIEHLDDNGKVIKTERIENDVDMRRKFRDFSEEQTRSGQVFQRYHMRKVWKRYYGVSNWKPFEKTQRIIEDKYLEKKLQFQKYMVNQTIGRVSLKRAAYMNCLLEGGEKCKTEHLNPPDVGGEELDADSDKALTDGKNEDNSALTKKLQEIGMKKILTSVAGGVGIGIGVLQIMGGLQSSVESGALSRVTADSLSDGYARAAAGYGSATHQILSGEDFDPEDARVLSETFDGFETSPVYLAGAAGATAAATQYVRDCDGDGTNETTLPAGETVCSNKKIIQSREGIKNSVFWPVIDALGTFYNTTMKGVFDWFGSVFQGLMDTIGVSAVINKLAEETGLAAQAAKYIDMALKWAIGFQLTGLEKGPEAYDAWYAGTGVITSTVGSTMGGDREDTIGGAPLTTAQVSAIMAEDHAYQQYALSKKGLFERYFSPEVDSSITSYAIMHTPSNITNMSSSFIAAINPVNVLGKFSTFFTARTHAAAGDATVNNPFGIVYMGYANDHPVLTMEESELNEKYQCSLPTAERPQNKVMGRPDGMPFDIYTQPDPCLLNKAVEKAGSMYFTGAYNDLNQ